MKPLNIIVADDHAFVCDALANIIQAVPHVKRVKQAHNGREVLELLDKGPYDILFLDIEMPILNGIETLQQIKKKGYPTKVVIVSMYGDAGSFMKVYRLGISGYILKNTSSQEITRAIQRITEGSEYFSHEVAKVLLNPSVAKQLSYTFHPTPADITKKEKDVLLMVCEQLSAKEIAEKMGLSEKTVERHKESLMSKTGALNQVGLAVYAIKQGIMIL